VTRPPPAPPNLERATMPPSLLVVAMFCFLWTVFVLGFALGERFGCH